MAMSLEGQIWTKIRTCLHIRHQCLDRNCSPPASGFEVFVTVGERSGMWLSGMVCGWGSLMVTGG